MTRSGESSTMNADKFVLELYKNKSFNDAFWSGLKAAILALSLLLSIYATYKCTSLRSFADSESQSVIALKQTLQDDEERLNTYVGLVNRLNETLQRLVAGEGLAVSRYDVVFDCFLTQRFSRPGTVTYDDCFVDTTAGAMNTNSGVFTVAVEGVYQLSFTAKYVSSSKGRFGAWSDIMVNTTVIADSQREYNGHDASDSESSTHTILVFYPLSVGDKVKVLFNRDGESYIHSDHDHDVHFTGRRVAALPKV